MLVDLCYPEQKPDKDPNKTLDICKKVAKNYQVPSLTVLTIPGRNGSLPPQDTAESGPKFKKSCTISHLSPGPGTSFLVFSKNSFLHVSNSKSYSYSKVGNDALDLLFVG